MIYSSTDPTATFPRFPGVVSHVCLFVCLFVASKKEVTSSSTAKIEHKWNVATLHDTGGPGILHVSETSHKTRR